MVEGAVATVPTEWLGPNPYYLMIATEEGGTRIDLDEPQWATTYADQLRIKAVWFLMTKTHHSAVLAVWVNDGDQPYYTARHVGITSSAGGNEIVAYGIGKKTRDGQMVRLWALPNGTICGGEDVSDFGIRFVRALGPK